MDLLDIFAAGFLVKPIYILSNNTYELSSLLHFSKLEMSRIGLYCPCIKVTPVIIKEYFRFVLKAVITKEIFRFVR